MYYYSDMKGSKFDGGKQIPSKGGSLVADTEPLFPRLHVNQTEKTGPRAPPRNKMALYEQFTIPSHRFVPSNQTVATGHQKQFDKYPSYPSYYMPSASPYGSMGHGALAQLHPSYGVGCDSTSSRSAVSYVEDIHRASQKPPLDNHGQNEGTSELKEICKQGSVKSSRSAAYPRSTCTNAVEDTRKDMNDFCVPSLPSHGFGKASIKSLGTQQKPERQISALSSSITGRPVEFSASCDAGLAPSVIENQSSSPGADFPVDNKGPQRNSEGRTVQEVQQVGQQVCTQRSPRLSFHDPEVNGSKNLAKSRAEPQGLNIRTDEVVPLCEDEQESLNSNSQCIQTKSRGASVEDIKVSSQSVEGSEKFVSPRDDSSSEERDAQGGENGDAINTTSPVWVVRKPQNGSTANANLLQHGGDKGLVPGHPVKPKDVIYVVGQQNFWRARKAILRQQRIFSDQVFELHKLIKVQQMLAESPDALIDADKNSEELAGASSYNATDEEEANLESTRRHTPSSKETFKGQPREIEAHHLGWPQTKQGGAYTSMPTLHPGGVSVWGYPSLGIPCVYPAYVPGSGFCTQLMGPMPQFTSFGLPLDQKKEVSGDGQSSYGCAAALGPQWHPAMCNNPPGSMYPDLFGSWYAMQPQRLLAGGAAAGPSTGSVSSINKQSEVSMQGMPLQWAKTNGGTHSRTRAEVLKSNTDCGQDSLPSVHAGNAMKTSGEALVQKRQDKRTASGTYGFRLGMSKPVVNNELRWLGELKNGAELTVDAEDDDEQVNDGECSPNRSLDALNLFPLVPTMSPNVHGGGSRDKQAGVGEWKGQVIRVTPRPAVAASESAAEILLSLQQERQQ